MKKVIFLFAIALMAGSFYSCEKNDDDVTVEKQYVEAIAGEFVAVEGDITLKSADLDLDPYERTWTTYSNNSDFYSGWELVDGREFITNSTAYNFWKPDAGNNPITFAAGESVYSNLTPDEDVRMVLETKNAAKEVVYLGINDFNPSEADFPLIMNAYRLGDSLIINTDAVTTLPGYENLVVTVKFDLYSINLGATKMNTLSKGSSTPNGREFVWADIVYEETPVEKSIVADAGDFELYNGLTDKVMGDITITITEPGNTALNIVKTVAAKGPGKGLKIVLETAKIGWFDSESPLTLSENDITVKTVKVDID